MMTKSERLLRHIGHVRHFLAAARAGNFRTAARRLNISQSAISKSVHILEDEFGVPLFERFPRGVALTTFGEALFRRARVIEMECGYARLEIEGLRSGVAGALRIAAGPVWGSSILPRAIGALHAAHPDARFTIVRGPSAVSLPLLEKGEIDVAIGALSNEMHAEATYVSRPLLDIDMRVMAADTHPLRHASEIEVAALCDYPWVLFHQDERVARRIRQFFELRGLKYPNFVVNTESFLAVLELLRSGPMLTCLAEPLLMIARHHSVGIVPVRADIWRFRSGLTYRRSLEGLGILEVLAAELDRTCREFRLQKNEALAQ